jgi:hypothetical protein
VYIVMKNTSYSTGEIMMDTDFLMNCASRIYLSEEQVLIKWRRGDAAFVVVLMV